MDVDRLTSKQIVHISFRKTFFVHSADYVKDKLHIITSEQVGSKLCLHVDTHDRLEAPRGCHISSTDSFCR